MCEEFIGAFLGIQTLPVCDDGLKISIRLLLITGTKRILGELKLHLLPVDGISGVLNLLLEIRDVRIQAEEDIVTCVDGECSRSREVVMRLADRRLNFFGPKGCSPNATARIVE